MKTATEAMKAKLKATKPSVRPTSLVDGLSSGSTLINLLCTGCPNVAIPRGSYYVVIGDTDSGKSVLSMSIFAEAVINKAFNDYRLIYDGPEFGATESLRHKFFGNATDRIEQPAESGPSSTIEEFYFNLDDALKGDKPFVYVLDSMDALSSESEQDKFAKRKLAHRKGCDVAGSYGDGKAKVNSSGIRQALNGLKKSGSILIVINQTRDNIGFTAMRQPKTRSGGHAMIFYADCQIWTSVKERIKKVVRGTKVRLGTRCLIQMRRDRIAPPAQESVEIPIYFKSGIDDVGSMIDYLMARGHWKGTDARVEAKEFGFAGNKEVLIEKIETDGGEKELKMITAEVWRDMEEAAAVRRKSRYG